MATLCLLLVEVDIPTFLWVAAFPVLLGVAVCLFLLWERPSVPSSAKRPTLSSLPKSVRGSWRQSFFMVGLTENVVFRCLVFWVLSRSLSLYSLDEAVVSHMEPVEQNMFVFVRKRTHVLH